MNKRDFTKLVNEELNKFDFLNNDEFLKEQEVTDLLQNPDLQKQFICDSLLDRSDKVRIKEIADSHITGNWDEAHKEDADRVSLLYSVDIEYKYDATKEPLLFNLHFNADRIDISVGGWYDPGRYGGTTDTDYEAEGESWFNTFDWGDIGVSLQTIDDGLEAEFIAFEKAPPRIQTLFMRHYLEGFVADETLEFRTDDMNDKVQNIPYC